MEWSIQEVARSTGTTSRTLRHYDDIGLLPPARIGSNGYRYYDQASMVRMQRILLLPGGPGGSGIWLPALMPLVLPEVAERYQLVSLDPRGTGAGALECPAVQAQTGMSDLLAATPEAVAECAARLGRRAAHQSTADPAFTGVFDSLAEAVAGDLAGLDGLVARAEQIATSPALRTFSAGRHIATLCADTPMPWGGPGTDPAARGDALDAALAGIAPEATWPFRTSLARELAPIDACLRWPAVEVPAGAAGPLPEVPVLVLTGERHLSTSLETAEAELGAFADLTSVVVPESGMARRWGRSAPRSSPTSCSGSARGSGSRIRPPMATREGAVFSGGSTLRGNPPEGTRPSRARDQTRRNSPTMGQSKGSRAARPTRLRYSITMP